MISHDDGRMGCNHQHRGRHRPADGKPASRASLPCAGRTGTPVELTNPIKFKVTPPGPNPRAPAFESGVLTARPRTHVQKGSVLCPGFNQTPGQSSCRARAELAKRGPCSARVFYRVQSSCRFRADFVQSSCRAGLVALLEFTRLAILMQKRGTRSATIFATRFTQGK